jgi:hypothetical protein
MVRDDDAIMVKTVCRNHRLLCRIMQVSRALSEQSIPVQPEQTTGNEVGVVVVVVVVVVAIVVGVVVVVVVAVAVVVTAVVVVVVVCCCTCQLSVVRVSLTRPTPTLLSPLQTSRGSLTLTRIPTQEAVIEQRVWH